GAPERAAPGARPPPPIRSTGSNGRFAEVDPGAVRLDKAGVQTLTLSPGGREDLEAVGHPVDAIGPGVVAPQGTGGGRRMRAPRTANGTAAGPARNPRGCRFRISTENTAP